MDVQVLRIDDRLIHGQIVVGWLPTLEIVRVVVVDDALMADPSRCEMISLAMAPGQTVEFMEVAGSAQKLAQDASGDRAMILFENPSAVLGFVEDGGVVEIVNVGGMHFSKGKQEIHTGYFVSEKDLEALRALAAKGIRLEIRALPGNNPVSLNALLEKGTK